MGSAVGQVNRVCFNNTVQCRISRQQEKIGRDTSDASTTADKHNEYHLGGNLITRSELKTGQRRPLVIVFQVSKVIEYLNRIIARNEISNARIKALL